jgi:hypothetical protein
MLAFSASVVENRQRTLHPRASSLLYGIMQQPLNKLIKINYKNIKLQLTLFHFVNRLLHMNKFVIKSNMNGNISLLICNNVKCYYPNITVHLHFPPIPLNLTHLEYTKDTRSNGGVFDAIHSGR